ncbi:MAG: SDR family oxidoreductase [Anaerolineae bacterium]
MATEKQVALVTGGNRGLGYEVGRQLADKGLRVLLTARDADTGEAAAQALRQAGADADFHPLDIANEDSVQTLLAVVRAEYGRLDVLVNNAGILIDRDVTVLRLDEERLRKTMDTNFYGTWRMCRAFLPLMREHHYGRVVNVSTDLSVLGNMRSATAAYRLSKVAINALTITVADEVRSWGDFKVNVMSPGWVRTDMGGGSAPRGVEDGADTITWLATLPSDGPTGGFFRDRKPLGW